MSIPKNHHHVSQCHIRYFKNNETGKYYLYNKELDIFEKPKPSEESIFSEDYGNTRFKEGELDHKGLEDELNIKFETDFVQHADKVIEAVSNSTYEIDSLKASLQYLLRYAVISEMRHPSFKKGADDRVNDLMSKTLNHIFYLETGEKSDFKISDFEKSKTKYSNLLDYNDIAEERLQSMGNLSIDVVVAGDNDEFILPDTGCYLKRARINNYINKNIQEIAVIGLPLTYKIFILATSVKLEGVKEGVFVVKNIPSLLVEDANRELYINGIKKVLARNKNVLEFIVEKYKSS